MLTAALLLVGCTGEDRTAEAETSGEARDHLHINLLVHEGDPPAGLERVPLDPAGYRYGDQTVAVEGWLFSFTGTGMTLADYRTGTVPASLPEADYEGRSLTKGSTRLNGQTRPLVAEGYLYFADERIDGRVGDDVREVGRYDLSTGRAEALASVGEFPQLAVDAGILYYLADGALTAFDTAGGGQLWQVPSSAAADEWTRLAISGNAVAVIDAGTAEVFDLADGRRLLTRSSSGGYLALTADASGFVLAERNGADAGERRESLPVLLDLIRVDSQGAMNPLGSVTIPDGVPGIGERPDAVGLLADDEIVLVHAGSEVNAVDTVSGAVRWSAGVPVAAPRQSGPPAYRSFNFSAALSDGTAYIYVSSYYPDLDGPADPDSQAPAPTDPLNRLLAVEASTGAVTAAWDIGNQGSSSGPFPDDGSLVFLAGTGDGGTEALILPQAAPGRQAR